jgi:hypothetical protein
MRMPGFSAETSLYETTAHYRLVAQHGHPGKGIVPAKFPYEFTQGTLYVTDLVSSSLRDFIYSDFLAPVSPRECCRRCVGSFPCADEPCRRQRLHSCSRKCRAEVIGGCGCPPGRAVCNSSRADGECCRAGEVCASNGCFPPNQICKGLGGCLGKCLPSGCCPPHRIVCNNECCAYGVKACSPDGFCVGCGAEGESPCPGLTCKGDLHLNIDMSSNQLVCTAFCGHNHQHACRTTYPVSGGVRSRYRCFKHSRLSANGPADPSNCICVPNTVNNVENDVSDDSGFCISTFPGAGDVPDPPDCDGPGCSSKHEGDQTDP